MTEDESSFFVDRIINGKYFFNYQNRKYYFQQPSIDIKIQSNFIYQDTYEANIFDPSFVDPERLDFLLKFHRIIPSNYEDKVKQTEKNIENLKVSLYKNFTRKTTRLSYKKTLNKEKKNLSDLFNKKHSWDFLLVKNFADKIKTEFIFAHSIYCCSSNVTTFDYNNLNYSLLYNIINLLQDDPLRNVETYKYIANSGAWRNYWSCSKENIFPGPVVEWTDEQRALVSMSRMFDAIYENPDCPNAEVFDDFDALDGWMILQKRKNIADKKEKGVNELLSDKHKDSSEIFLLANNPEDASDIVNMNSEESLFKYKKRLEILSKKGDKPIKDSDFPDIKAAINRKIKGP